MKSVFIGVCSLAVASSISLNHDKQFLVRNNLAGDNWIYGSLTEQQLKQSIFEQMTQNQNLLKCVPEYPFFDGTKCTSCPTSDPYFNLSTKKCESCPKDKPYKNHRCGSTASNHM